MPRPEHGKHPQDSTGVHLLRQLDQLQAGEPLPAVEPPDLIDQAVRNLARRELHSNSSSPVAGKLRWIAGLATVSVALLAIGISLVQSPPLPPAAGPQPKEEFRQLESAPGATATPAGDIQARSVERTRREAVSNAAAKSSAESSAGSAAESRAESRAATPPAVESLPEPAAMKLNDALEFDAAGSPAAESAQAWLELARQLYDRGLHAEAAEQLDALVAEYPELELPEWAVKLRAEQP